MFDNREDLAESWKLKGKCIDHDPELWYPPRDKDKYKEIADEAKSICLGKDGKPECPVRITCLLYADSYDDQFGIWGGLSHRERSALTRKAARHGKTLKEWIEDGSKRK